MSSEALSWEYKPSENPDWGFARNLFTVLKRPQATWTQSVFSVRHENLLAPNRDYSYQGLCAFNNGVYFKLLDCVFFGIKGSTLEPRGVTAYPWKNVYRYSGDGIDVDVSYFLSRDNKSGVNGKIIFEIKNQFIKELIIKPLVDIREVNTQSTPEKTRARVNGNFLTVSSGKNTISFFLKDSSILAKTETTDWRYKLGSGFRESISGSVRFAEEWRRPVFVGEMHKTIRGNESVSLIVNCNRKNNDFDEGIEQGYAKKIARKFDCDKSIKARVLSLNSFGVFENRAVIPDAGDFWFRQVWLRDLLETANNSFKTYERIDSKSIPKFLNWAVKQQDRKTGLFPNFKGNYESADANFLFSLLSEKYLEFHKNKKLQDKITSSLKLLLNGLRNTKNGMSIKEGLFYCMPWQSWTDSKVEINGKLVSTRIPRDWLSSCDPNVQVLLPEINAMFIRTLKFSEKLGLELGVSSKEVENNYRKTFLSKDFIYSLVMGDMKDPTESSMSLVSSVLLYGHIFGKDDMKRFWKPIERLLVRKNGKLFGVLCRNQSQRIYYNDNQYHGAVIWPRDTPYLIDYLRLIGKGGLVDEILESNIQHQMDEGAIFYSAELFSLPEGNNPNPTETSNSPVPVKNPIQLWSNFCDAYISR